MKDGFSDENTKEGRKSIETRIQDSYVSREVALDKLGLTERELKEYKEYKEMTPVQRVLSDLDFSDDFMVIAFATNTYIRENSKLGLAEFKNKETHLEEFAKVLKKMEFTNSKSFLIKAIYSLYWAYYNGANGTKEDNFAKLSKDTRIVENIDVSEHNSPVKEELVRGKNWAKNQKKKSKKKAKKTNNGNKNSNK